VSRRNGRDAKAARRAARFERHAALVNEREGDPRYAHVTERHPDGSRTISVPRPVMAELAEAVRYAEEQYPVRFGREMRPDDPIFFDPDADEPVPVSAEKVYAEMIAAAQRTGDPHTIACARATAELGYMVTAENRHMWTAHEAEAFEDAAARHYETEIEGSSA
jgi:hypothetical protein